MDTRTFQFFEVKQAYKTVKEKINISFQREQIEEFQKINPVIIVTAPNNPQPILVTQLSEIMEKNKIIISETGEFVRISISEENQPGSHLIIKDMLEEE